jgi:hypothetical protein
MAGRTLAPASCMVRPTFSTVSMVGGDGFEPPALSV